MMLAGLLAVMPLAAKAEEPGAMALALSAADARDWTTARAAAAAAGPLAEALIGWQALRAGHGDFDDYLNFVQRHSDWPAMDAIRSRGDGKLRALTPEEAAVWFDGRLPTSYRAHRAYVAALPPAEAAAERARFFQTALLEPAEEEALLTEHEAELAPLIPARITAMLDRQEWQQAARLIPRLPVAERALPNARIALQAGRTGVDDLILGLPDDQRSDPGLTMDRYLWRVGARMHDGAQALMLEASASAETLRDPAQWASMRVDYARLAMRNGDFARALQLAAPHHLPPENRFYADLEWLAGYAALKTDDPARALEHFLHLETVVGAAISKARALYWQGRAHQALGDEAAAEAAWRQAADQPGVYYGQLAAERLGIPLPVEFAVAERGLDRLPDWRGASIAENAVYRAGLWLLGTGRVDEAQRFFLHLAQGAVPEDIARMSRLMYEAGYPWHGLRLAKQSANQGVIWPVAHFPLTGLETEELGPPPELVMAIARQESEFNHTARSHVGAQGLMQVMPGTAEDVARSLGIRYEPSAAATRRPITRGSGAAYLSGAGGPVRAVGGADRLGLQCGAGAAGALAGRFRRHPPRCRSGGLGRADPLRRDPQLRDARGRGVADLPGPHPRQARAHRPAMGPVGRRYGPAPAGAADACPVGTPAAEALHRSSASA